jgi:hypothetical protein
MTDKNRSAIQIAVGAFLGAVIGAVIGNATHLPGFWPEIVTGLGAAAGVFLAHLIWPGR